MRPLKAAAFSQREGDRLRARAVWMYYVEGATQNEIADRLDINRVSVVRMLADARRRNEVRITISAPVAELVELERGLEIAFNIKRVIVAPNAEEENDPVSVIAAAAGGVISSLVKPGLTIGVGWGRTLYNTLPFIDSVTHDGLRVVSLLGGIAAARRFNPAEFAWQFAELFQGEGFLIPAPAVVDSPETRHALLERCGLAAILDMADKLDVALLSVGGITALTTSYRTGYLSESDRRSLIEAGAVGDVLYNFISKDGAIVDHEVNRRVISADMEMVKRSPERVLVSGGPEKHVALRAAIRMISPTILVTDANSARSLLETALVVAE
jgi:deoxyribonucleoside regulator